MARPVIRCCGQECPAPAFLDLRGFLSFWILWELRLGPLLGAQVADRLEWRRGTPLSPGTLYPALAALEQEHLVKKQRTGRDTRYTITSKGQTEMDCARGFLRIVLSDVTGPQQRNAAGTLPLVP